MEITATGTIEEGNISYWLPTGGRWMKEVSREVWEDWQPVVNIREYEEQKRETQEVVAV